MWKDFLHSGHHECPAVEFFTVAEFAALDFEKIRKLAAPRQAYHAVSVSDTEKEGANKCQMLARRIGAPHKSLRFKASLCALILTPTLAWGTFPGENSRISRCGKL